MPINYRLYPADWKAISARIRERDGNRCKRCGVPNGALIIRSDVDAERYIVYCEETGGTMWPDGNQIRASEEPEEFGSADKYTQIVITVHHIDHNPANNDDSNLEALCQLHHLRADAQHHARSAAATRQRKHDETTGQLALFGKRD